MFRVVQELDLDAIISQVGRIAEVPAHLDQMVVESGIIFIVINPVIDAEFKVSLQFHLSEICLVECFDLTPERETQVWISFFLAD